jgi:hypothetical protein
MRRKRQGSQRPGSFSPTLDRPITRFWLYRVRGLYSILGREEGEMAEPLIVIIPHSLGKVEASRRLKSGFAGIRTAFGDRFSIVAEVWTEDHLEFRIGLFGQAATGTIDVSDEHVRLVVQLPWLLAKLAGKAKALIQKQGQLLLDKK